MSEKISKTKSESNVDETLNEAPPPKKKIGAILGGEMVLAEFANNDWRGIAPDGAQPSDLENPEVWSVVAQLFKPMDLVKIISRDAKYWAELLVTDAGHGFARVKLLRFVDLPSRQGTAARVPEGYRITLADVSANGYQTWQILREKDGVILNKQHRCDTQEEAIRFLLDHPTLRNEKLTQYFP